MLVEICYFDSQSLGGFWADWAEICQNGSSDEGQEVTRLVTEFFAAQLPALRGARLKRQLEAFQVWRVEGAHRVIKTVDLPCIAFTARADTEKISLIALGACFRYPGDSQDLWWTQVIQPRVQSL